MALFRGIPAERISSGFNLQVENGMMCQHVSAGLLPSRVTLRVGRHRESSVDPSEWVWGGLGVGLGWLLTAHSVPRANASPEQRGAGGGVLRGGHNSQFGRTPQLSPFGNLSDENEA